MVPGPPQVTRPAQGDDGGEEREEDACEEVEHDLADEEDQVGHQPITVSREPAFRSAPLWVATFIREIAVVAR